MRKSRFLAWLGMTGSVLGRVKSRFLAKLGITDIEARDDVCQCRTREKQIPRKARNDGRSGCGGCGG